MCVVCCCTDLKIYSSDEGRVQMTAAAFTKALLDLEGNLAPILVSLVRKDGINSLLDDSTPAERNVAAVREKLYSMITSGSPVDKNFAQELAPSANDSVVQAAELAAGVKATADSLLSVLHEIREEIEALMEGDSLLLLLLLDASCDLSGLKPIVCSLSTSQDSTVSDSSVSQSFCIMVNR